MKFFLKKKFKKLTYFYDDYSNAIGLYHKDYLEIKDLFPFHSIELLDEYAIVQMYCPLKSYYTLKSFYHYGKRLDFNYLKEKNLFPYEPWYEGKSKGYNSDIVADGDLPLPKNFNPCSLCKNELPCMFTMAKANFQPKQYDTLYFIDILKENGFIESEDMHNLYNRLISYSEDDDEYSYYIDSVPSGKFDYMLVFLFILPTILCFLPFYFLTPFACSVKEKIRLLKK